jgi:PAS domain S-box-containing protein
LTEPAWLGRVAPAAAGFAVATGLLTLAGYGLWERIVVSVLPGSVPMAANTAVLFVLTGVSLWLVAPHAAGPVRRRAGQGLASVVVLIAAAILLQYVLGRSLGLDLLFFADQARAWAGSGTPGRFSPHTGVGFVVTGLALVLLDTDARRGHRYARVLTAAGALVAGIGLTGRAFGLQYLYGSNRVTGMAVATAVTFIVLSAGLLACRADRPLALLFSSRGLGSVTVRRLTPAVGAAVLLAGVLFAATRDGATPLAGFGVTAGVTILVLTMCVVIVRTGRILNEIDHDQRRLLASLRDEHGFNEAILRSLPEGVIAIAPDGTVLRVSRRWCEITGFTEQDAVGRTAPYPWWVPGQVTQRAAELVAVMDLTVSTETQIQMRRADGAVLEVLRGAHPVLDDEGRLRVLVGTVRDITERNRIEIEQQGHADELTHYFQLSTDLMCIAGTDGYFKRLNPAWELALGYTEAELTSRPYVEFVHPDDVAHTATEMYVQRAQGKSSASFENRYRCRDGSYRWLQWNAFRQGDLVYAVARDTTAHRLAAADQARLAAIVDSTDDAIISKTLDGTITSWNPAAERIYGLRADQTVGQSIRIVFGTEHDELLEQVGRGESVNLDTVRTRVDGAALHLGLTVTPIRDSAGAIVGAASITRDNTAGYKAEERFRRLLQGAPDAMMIADAEGTIILVNAQAERVFGYLAADLIGQPVEMLMPRTARQKHLDHRAGYARNPSVRAMGSGMDLCGLRRDGTEFPIEISLAPLDTDQGALVSASIRDVSARKEIERDLAAARDAALAAAQVKSQFVALVSHEIRTPMNGVIGLTALLMNTPLEPTQRRYVEAIRASGQALLGIINGILDFSKIEYGKVILRESDFALDRLIEDVVQVAAEAGRSKDLPVQAYYPPRLPTRVRGDEGRLRQVLLNLLANAVKFTEKGEVLLRVDPTGDDAAQAPGFTLSFTVADTGIGIAAPDLARIFKPFSQVDAATNREFGGTGLGLAICEQFVRLMGGRLDVVSEPGLGSRFSFTIALKPPADDSESHLPSSNALTGRRLIVVDGSAARRTMMAEHCIAWGLHTVTAANGEDALAILRDASSQGRPCDVAVIDQRLPDVEGAMLARRITADPDVHTPILIVLTSGSHQDEQAAIAAGASAALPKPVGPSQLYNGLFDLLGPLVEVPAHSSFGLHVDPGDHGLVLLAEDNAINQLVAVDTLETLGYRVDVAHNGIEALALAAAHTYLAVLMDCQMPKMDGFAATAALREREGTGRHTPIIAMTAGALTEDRDRCLAAGMDDHLAKPIDPDELSAALQRWTTEQDPSAVDI